MKIKKSIPEQIFNVFNILFMLFIIVISLYPFWYVLCASFSDPSKLVAHTGFLFWPTGFSVQAYELVMKTSAIVTGFKNTFFVVVVGVALNMLMTSMGAYVLSRKHFMMRNFFMMLITFTMFFSGGLIPLYFTVKDLHLDNTLWALIFPVAVNAFNLIILRTGFASIHDSLEESAKLDGAGHLTIMFRIVIPLAMPTVSVIILYYMVSHWNSWFNAMIYLRSREKFPLQLILREILLQNSTDNMIMGSSADDSALLSDLVKYAVIIVSTVPILCVYPFIQKYFVKGVMIGAVKE